MPQALKVGAGRGVRAAGRHVDPTVLRSWATPLANETCSCSSGSRRRDRPAARGRLQQARDADSVGHHAVGTAARPRPATVRGGAGRVREYRNGGIRRGRARRPSRTYERPPASRVRSLRTRLLIQILPVVALAVIAMTAFAVKVASPSQRDAVYGHMSQLIKRQAARFDGEARRAQALAHCARRRASRPTPSATAARGVASSSASPVRNPDLLGTWVAFEPDAFGADDAAHVNAARSATATAGSPSGPSA